MKSTLSTIRSWVGLAVLGLALSASPSHLCAQVPPPPGNVTPPPTGTNPANNQKPAPASTGTRVELDFSDDRRLYMVDGSNRRPFTSSAHVRNGSMLGMKVVNVNKFLYTVTLKA